MGPVDDYVFFLLLIIEWTMVFWSPTPSNTLGKPFRVTFMFQGMSCLFMFLTDGIMNFYGQGQMRDILQEGAKEWMRNILKLKIESTY